ncbi:MAG: 16S rRNA (guanine(966)-N(2))-methyltransferase RsmD [Flavobacteriales bacterium]|nr:16S rRNA (guanine(966)-N(2))-methyltransferase RsmD [Flavobacteriales bacterium]
MRIISGRWKGRYLIAPSNLPVRPTTDMAKEALFNILGNIFDMDSLTVIDLFAGTGNISYEFASRGALSVRSVDMERLCTKYIAQTAKQLELDGVISTVNMDVFKYIAKTQMQADVIFADPPYSLSSEKYSQIVENVFANGLLSDEGVLVVEHPKGIDLSSFPQFTRMRKYGTVHFSFFEHPSEDDEEQNDEE